MKMYLNQITRIISALFVIRKGYPAQRPLSIKSSSCSGAEKAFFRFVGQTGYPAPTKHPVCFLSYSHQFRDLFADDIRGLNDWFCGQMRVAVRDRIDAVSRHARDDVIRISRFRRHRREAVPQRVRAKFRLSDRRFDMLFKERDQRHLLRFAEDVLVRRRRLFFLFQLFHEPLCRRAERSVLRSGFCVREVKNLLVPIDISPL